MTPGVAPVAAPPAPPAPPEPEITKLRAFTADPNVPEQAKRDAVAAFARTYPSTVPAQPSAAPADQGSLQATPTRGVIRGLFPEGGALGMLGDIVTNPTEIGGTLGAAGGAELGLLGAAALAPETMGASLLLPLLGAGFGGYLGREAGASVESPAPGGALVAPGKGRTRSSTERYLGLAVDALPTILGNWLRPIVLSGPEVEAASKALALGKEAGERGAKRMATGAAKMAEERVAAVPEPAAMARPPKPGRAPKAPGEVPTPEVAPGVPAGAMSPLRPPPTAPTLGPEFTTVAQGHLQDVEKRKAAHYTAEVSKATELDLKMPIPQEVVRGAGDALDALNRSGLELQVQDRARKLLESIRDVRTDKVTKTAKGALPTEVVEDIRPGIDTVTYADLDAWRQDLQPLASSFRQLGQAKSMEKGSIGHVLGLIDNAMDRLAQGTPVEPLHRVADDFFVHEVQPARELAKTVIRGEFEPNKFVDALTGPAHEMKFARYIKQLDRDAPGQAIAFRRVKLQNMIDKSTKGGAFDPDDFLRQFDPDKMPVRTREALLQGTPARELREFMGNVEQAKALARTSQADAQATAEAAYAAAAATHAAAAADVTRAVAEGRGAQAAFATARKHAAAQDPVLVNARRKLASQQMLVKAPAGVVVGGAAMKSLMNGDAYPLITWLGGGALAGGGASAGLSMLLSTPKAVPILNGIFRAVSSGASERRIARLGAQLVTHLGESTAREVLQR